MTVADRLARSAREVAADWGLTLGAPFPASYSFVAPAGDDAVLKLQPEEDDESTHEPDALTFWNGDGAPRLLRHDPARRAMLIERARPGQDASSLGDDEAIGVALGVGRRLWRPAERGRPYESVGDRVPLWLEHAGAHALVDAAKALYATLRPRADVLVHGDLHHHNLLRHGERWIAIDPKPIIGEREYDVATLLWNPIGRLPTRATIERRIGLFAAAGLDERRIRAWAVVRGAYLGFPLSAETEEASPQLVVARALL